MKTLSLIITLSIFSVCISLQSQPGSLDLSFGTDGTVMLSDNTSIQRGFTGAVQGDGKILIGGLQENNNVQDFSVARYNTDGTLDNSFGQNGLVVFDGGETAESVWTIMVQSDGKILLGGSIYHQSSTYDDFALIRLNPDGSPDNSFGNAGLVYTDFEGGWDNAYSMAIQDDGKIILGGDGYRNNKRNASLVRYNTDGTVDESFGFSGVGWLSVGTVNDKTKDIALQEDGKIVVVGAANDGQDDQAFVIRFNADGNVDSFFGNNGMFIIDIGAREDRLWSVCVLDNGSIIAGGYTRNDNTGDNDYLFLKLNSDGTQDMSFGSNGIKMFTYSLNDQVIDMCIQDDGKILSVGGGFSFELLRLLENGDLDSSFGDNGKVNTTIGTYCFGNAIFLYPDERAVVAGQATDGDTQNFAAARYHLANEGGIAEQNNSFSSVMIYPNPINTGGFNLAFSLLSDEAVSINLLGINGSLIYKLAKNEPFISGMHHRSLKIPAELPAGIYLLQLKSQYGSSTTKLEVR